MLGFTLIELIYLLNTPDQVYGKDSSLMYEHSFPASIIRKILLDSDPSEASVQNVLQGSGYVVVMRDEDIALRSQGLTRKMPDSWHFGDNLFARYDASGIELSDYFLKVKGKIKR